MKKSRKLLLQFAIALFASQAYAQVGVGTPLPNTSAQLDVVATNKGVLIPRVALTNTTDAVTITNGNVTSLLVYNTATAGAAPNNVVPGYYYWDGTKWSKLAVMSDVLAAQTITTLTNNGDGTYTYVSEDGTITVIDIPGNETVTNLVDNGNGTITYTNEAGTAQIINIAAVITAYETLTTLIDNGNGTLTYTDEDGVAHVINIANIVNNNETLTTLVNNGDGTLTYTDEDGVAHIITVSVNSTNTYITNGTVDTNGDGVPDNNVTLQDVINNLTSIIDANETLTTLIDNSNGTLTYTDEDGVVHVINLATIIDNYETVTNVVDNGNGTITYTNENGTAQTINIAAMVTSNQTVTTLNNNGNGTYTYTSENGTATTFPATPEPWYNQATLAPATANTQSVYIQAPWVGIGTSTGQTPVSGERLFVQGAIRTTNSYYADYVLEEYVEGESQLKPEYQFNSLDSVAAFIQKNKHLPGVTGIKDVQKTNDGYAFDISSLSIQSLEKIEELFLYVIEQDKKIASQNNEIESLKTQLKKMQEALILLLEEQK